MSVLFGHPTGTPFSHHAGLAYFESGLLESFCVPWMPSPASLRAIGSVPGFRSNANRLARRHFSRLATAPKSQGRIGEFKRLLIRGIGLGDERLTNEANEWLMRRMARECGRPRVTAVHAYEDCSLWQFQEAKRRGRACIYEMPIGYYPAWERIRGQLEREYSDWLPAARPTESVRRQRKTEEMKLADLVLVPSRFVASTILEFQSDKTIAFSPYGIDLAEWPEPATSAREHITFLFVGQCSIRKGIPLLLDAWQAAGLKNASLKLVGAWQLAERKRREMPSGCTWTATVSTDELKVHYGNADVFVFPTNFEGRALVVIEALASGLPVLTTKASGAGDLIDQCGRLIATNDRDELVAALRWFSDHRDLLPAMKRTARRHAETCSWDSYRKSVTDAVRSYV